MNITIDDVADQISVSLSEDLQAIEATITENDAFNITVGDGVFVAGSNISLSSIDDFSVSNPQDGQVLKYRSSLSKWTNEATEYRHIQNNASATWTITHNLGLENYLPNISLRMSGGATYNNIQAFAQVEYINENELTISFLSEKSGYAFLKI